MYFQPKGFATEKSSQAMTPELKEAIKQVAKEANCSMNFVKNTILADALDVEEQPRFYNVIKERIKRAKSKTLKARGRSNVREFKQAKRRTA